MGPDVTRWPRRYHGPDGHARADADDGLLPPSPERDRDYLLDVWTADLHGVHGLRPGRDQVPRVSGLAVGNPEGGLPGSVARRSGDRLHRHEGPPRTQRPRLPRSDRPVGKPHESLRGALPEGGALRAVRRTRRLVAPRHVRVPARKRAPYFLQHAHALVVRAPARAPPRPWAVPRRVLHLDPRR